MLWVVFGAVMVGLLWFVGRTHKQTSVRELGKGEGHAGSARYKNRGSRRREKKIKSP